MDIAPGSSLAHLAALEAENAELRSRLQACEQSYAVLQAEVAERRRHEQASQKVTAKSISILGASEVLKQSLSRLATDPDLDKVVGHVLTAIAHQFQSPLTEYWSQDAHTAYVERLYFEGRILDRAAIAQTFPGHAGLVGFRVPPAMVEHVPLCQRQKPIIYEDHSANPFTQDLLWVKHELVPRGLSKEINVPVLLGDTTIGALSIHVGSAHQFTAEQVVLAQCLADQVGLAVEMQRLAAEAKQVAIAKAQEKAAQERVNELIKANDVLKQSLDSLAAEPSLEKFLGQVLTAIAEQFNSPVAEYWYHVGDVAYIGMMSWQGEIYDHAIIAQKYPAHPGVQGFQIPPGLIRGETPQARKRYFVNEDISTNPFTSHVTWHPNHGLYKEINVPMVLDDVCLGALVVRLPRDYPITTQQIELAQSLSHQATLAVRLTQLAEEAREAAIARERDQAALDQMAKCAAANAALQRNLSWLAREKDLPHFLEQILLEIAQAVKADVAHLFVVHPDRMIELAARVVDGQLSDTGTPTEPALFAAPFSADITPLFQQMEDEDILQDVDLLAIQPEFVALVWPDIYEWHLREGRKQAGCLVLKAGDRSVGFLGFGFREYRDLSPETRELTMALANQAALAILLSQLATQQAQAEQERAMELAKTNTALQRSIDMLANDRHLESFLCSLLQEAIHMINGLDAQIFLYDPATHTLRPDLGVDVHGAWWLPPYGIIPADFTFSQPIPADITPVWSRMLAQGKPIHFPVDDPDQWPGAADFHRRRRCNGALCAPMLLGDEPLGFIGLTARDRESFTEAEVAFCHTITQQATLAIQMSRLAEEAQQTAIAREREQAAQKQAGELAAINEALTQRGQEVQRSYRLLSVVAQVTQDLLENPDLEQAIEQALQKLGAAAGADRTSLLDEIPVPGTDRWQHRTLMEWTTPNTPCQIDDPATELVPNDAVAPIIAALHAGRAVCLRLEEYPEPIQPAMAGINIKVSGLAPIFIEGQYYGCLCFDNCEHDRLWSDQEMDVLTTGAKAIGAALLRQRLMERVMQSQAEQQRAAELARANDALKQSLNAIAVDTNPQRIIAHILRIVAEQFETPLVEYWLHSDPMRTAHLSLTYWHGHILTAAEQPDHPGNTDFPSLRYLAQQEPPAPLPYFLIDDIRVDPYTQSATEQIGVDIVGWFSQKGMTRLLNIPLWLNEQTIGSLDIWHPSDRPFTQSQIELAHTFGQQITLVSYLNRLFEEAKQTVLFEERNRIASDIHDTLAQAFTGISLQLEVAKPLIHQEPETVEHILHHMSQLTKSGLAEARRSVWALYPPGEEYANLAQMLYESVEQMSRNTSIEIVVNLLGEPGPLSPYIGMNLLRIGQEALTNALKHSQAQTVLIELTYGADLVSLAIRDDGRGFTPPTNLDNLNGGFGLVGMYERCDRINAQLTILSEFGRGTQILVESPFH